MKIGLYKKFTAAEEIKKGFESLGHTVVEFTHTDQLQKGQVDFLLDINYHAEISDLAQTLDLPMATWSFDSGIRLAIKDRPIHTNEAFFIFNSRDLDYIKERTEKAWFVPFSAGDDFIKEVNPNASGVLSIMNSYDDVIVDANANFQQSLNSIQNPDLSAAFDLIRKLLDATVDQHIDNFTEDKFESILQNLIDSCGVDPFEFFPGSRDKLVHPYCQVLSSMQRKVLISELSKVCSLSVYGDDFWRNVNGINFKGSAPYANLSDLYNSAAININLTQIQGLGSTPQRIMHVLASGGFLLTNPCMEEEPVFQAGVHFDTFCSYTELKDKVVFYLENPEKRLEIAIQGHEEFIANHTMRHRCEFILERMKLMLETL